MPAIHNSAAEPLYIRNAGDPVNSSLLVGLDFDHHQVHEGESFQWTYGPAALANGASLDYRIVVGAVTATTRTPHLVIDIDSTVETWVYLYENPTTSSDGTAKVPLNRNRGSTATPNATFFEAPTVTGVGTLLTAYISGAGKSGGGAEPRGISEWVLKPSTVYLVRATAKTTGDNVAIRYQFYEDTGV